MSAIDDLELVISLACTVEDRTPSEQRALLRCAIQVEKARNASTTANMRSRFSEPPSRVVDYVEAYQLVTLTTADRVKVDRRRQGWVDAHSEPFLAPVTGDEKP